MYLSTGNNLKGPSKKESLCKSNAMKHNCATMSSTTLIWLTVIFGALLRFMLSLHPHSGEGVSPMFGDYEAQRHWMEITVNLPIADWYRNTSDNDLLYWGLDYPPLTAYHSYLTGKVGEVMNSSFVELHKSRGLETAEHKTFMRYSVLLVDLIIYFPAITCYFSTLFKRELFNQSSYSKWIALALIYPGQILIDHGHFQYNCISLGFTAAATTCLLSSHILVSAVLFSLALNYKQMSLYHSLPFFVYMLRLSLGQKNFLKQIALLFKLGFVVSCTFILLWFPFLINGNASLNVLHRIFPVARGIFEDKVANFWCSFNVFVKLKNISPELLLRLCISSTIAFSLPSLCLLFRNPTHRQFLLSLINVSLAFFLFSYQVHEKSILLVALPVLLYAPYDPIPSTWFLTISSFSLLHLAFKDRLVLPFLALNTIFMVYIVQNSYFKVLKKDWVCLLRLCSSIGAVTLFLCFCFIEPPSRFPDLWPLLTAMYSGGHFTLFLLYFNWSQLISNGIGRRSN